MDYYLITDGLRKYGDDFLFRINRKFVDTSKDPDKWWTTKIEEAYVFKTYNSAVEARDKLDFQKPRIVETEEAKIKDFYNTSMRNCKTKLKDK